MRGMNIFGVFLVCIGTAYFMFVFGYIISPMYPYFSITGDIINQRVEVASKISLWGSASCLIIGIFALVGTFIERYSKLICSATIYLVAMVSIVVAVSVSSLLFPLI